MNLDVELTTYDVAPEAQAHRLVNEVERQSWPCTNENSTCYMESRWKHSLFPCISSATSTSVDSIHTMEQMSALIFTVFIVSFHW